MPTPRPNKNAVTPSRKDTKTFNFLCPLASNRIPFRPTNSARPPFYNDPLITFSFCSSRKKKQDDDLQSLRKEVVALQIMKANYEQMVKHHQQSQPGQVSNQISEEVKLQVFEAMCESLFQSFDASVSVTNFTELSGCIFSWLEEHCKPQTLKQITGSILSQLKHN